MPRLFVLGGPEAGATHDVNGPVTLGRSPGCEVRLRHPSVSRRHAELAPDGEAWVVTDLDSRNGLRHAGKRVKRARLEDGDEFLLGELPLRLRFAVGDVPPAEAAPAALPARRDEQPVLEGLELEGEEFLAATAEYSPAAIQVRGAADRGAAESEQPEPSELDERARLIVEMQRRSRGGTLSADLAQRPWPIRFALYALAAGLALGLAYGAYLGVLGLRG